VPDGNQIRLLLLCCTFCESRFLRLRSNYEECSEETVTDLMEESIGKMGNYQRKETKQEDEFGKNQKAVF